MTLAEHRPPFSHQTRWNYLHCVRRLLRDLEFDGHAIAADLISPGDFPRLPHHLPRALSMEDDLQLQAELRRRDDLCSNALLLTRLAGMRIGECVDLAADCMRQLASDHWSLHVPLGKLQRERLVPADESMRAIVSRLQDLRAAVDVNAFSSNDNFLLPRGGRQSKTITQKLRHVLADAAQTVGCSTRVTPHQLRHSFATEMIRLGVSLPALMQLLGHKDIRMTLRYVEVTPRDLQREFHAAHRNAAVVHSMPVLTLPANSSAGLPVIQQGLTALRHLLEMYRRQLQDEKTSRTLHRLDRRLLAIVQKLEKLNPPQK
jgi:site-specific recombinase XerD